MSKPFKNKINTIFIFITVTVVIIMGYVEKEIARLEKEEAKVRKDIGFIQSKLNNTGFCEKAPAQLIAAEREKLAKAEEKLAKVLESIKAWQ